MKGRIASEARNWSEARETLRELIRDYPNSELISVARYGVAESFYQEKNYSRALPLFEILHRENDFAADEAWGAMVQLRRAELMAHERNYLAAIEIAEKIEDEFPTFSLQTEVDYLLGRSYMSRGEFTKARQHYARVIRADASRTTEVAAMAQWMTGESYFHQKQYILAIKAYEALVADTTFPKWQAASNLQIGKCYELLGNFDQAKKYYKRVVERFADSEMVGEAKVRQEIVDRKTSR
jgi:TolA-binding protein